MLATYWNTYKCSSWSETQLMQIRLKF